MVSAASSKITLNKNTNKEPDYVLGTFWWHVDGVTMDVPLSKSTPLTARTLSSAGGATEFANLYAAYEMLPAEEKQALEGLKVIHHTEASVRPVFHYASGSHRALSRDGPSYGAPSGVDA